jgi:predicted nucleic acid-binding protein
VLNAVRFGRHAEARDAAAALRALEGLHLQVEPLDWGLLAKANDFAWTCGVTLYDAVYLALAERLGLPFVTADEALAKKMRHHELVVRLGDFGKAL